MGYNKGRNLVLKKMREKGKVKVLEKGVKGMMVGHPFEKYRMTCSELPIFSDWELQRYLRITKPASKGMTILLSTYPKLLWIE